MAGAGRSTMRAWARYKRCEDKRLQEGETKYDLIFPARDPRKQMRYEEMLEVGEV